MKHYAKCSSVFLSFPFFQNLIDQRKMMFQSLQAFCFIFLFQPFYQLFMTFIQQILSLFRTQNLCTHIVNK